MLSGSACCDDLHLLDVAVAAHAADAGVHVGAVVEVGVVGAACAPAPSASACRSWRCRGSAASAGLSRFTTRWQFMQTWVGGTLATADVSTEAWQ